MKWKVTFKAALGVARSLNGVSAHTLFVAAEVVVAMMEQSNQENEK